MLPALYLGEAILEQHARGSASHIQLMLLDVSARSNFHENNNENGDDDNCDDDDGGDNDDEIFRAV